MRKLKSILSSTGFTLMETVVSLGLAGVVTFAGVKIMGMTSGQKTEISQDTETMTLVKMVESQLLSTRGCEMIVGKKVGDTLTLLEKEKKDSDTGTNHEQNPTGGNGGLNAYERERQRERTNSNQPGSVVESNPTTVTPDRKLPVVKMEKLAITELMTPGDVDESGLARITITTKRLDNGRIKNTDMFMPINMIQKDGATIIESCNLSYLRTFEVVKKQVCEGTYGVQTKNMDCGQALLLVQKMAAESICKDLYGKNPTMSGVQCDLKQLHTGKGCGGGQKVRGFDANGGVICG